MQRASSGHFNLISVFNFLMGWFPNTPLRWEKLLSFARMTVYSSGVRKPLETKAASEHIPPSRSVINVLGLPLFCLFQAQMGVCMFARACVRVCFNVLDWVYQLDLNLIW